MTRSVYILDLSTPQGPVLAQLRIAASVTKGKMAQVLDVHPDTVSRYESPTSTIPLTKALEYLNHLGVECALTYR